MVFVVFVVRFFLVVCVAFVVFVAFVVPECVTLGRVVVHYDRSDLHVRAH